MNDTTEKNFNVGDTVYAYRDFVVPCVKGIVYKKKHTDRQGHEIIKCKWLEPLIGESGALIECCFDNMEDCLKYGKQKEEERKKTIR